MDSSTTPHFKLEDVGIFSKKWLFTKYFLLNTYDQNQSITSFETLVLAFFVVKYRDLLCQKLFEDQLKLFLLENRNQNRRIFYQSNKTGKWLESAFFEYLNETYTIFAFSRKLCGLLMCYSRQGF